MCFVIYVKNANSITRRNFLKKMSLAGAGVALTAGASKLGFFERLFGMDKLKAQLQLKKKKEEDLLKKATWLNNSQRKAIISGVLKSKVADPIKLTKLLASIIYAELNQDANGKVRTCVISNVMGLFKNSLGSWQLNKKVCASLQLKEEEFEHTMKDDQKGVHMVIKYLKRLGLKRSPEHLFAEYNHGENAVIISSLQRLLNQLRKGKKKIDEDGFWGPDTEIAIDEVAKDKGIKLRSKGIDPNVAFKQLGGSKLIVPKHEEIRDWRYFLRHFKAGRLRKSMNYFANDVSVKRYVAAGMKAYKHLS